MYISVKKSVLYLINEISNFLSNLHQQVNASDITE